VAIGAVALGAKFIEKHFTISKKMKGPDHIASLEPDEFSSMVKQIRNIEQAIGKFQKKPNKKELSTSFLVRQSLHAKIDIKKGEKFNLKNICLMRPNDGLPALNLKKIIGCKAKFSFNKYDPIK
jgi:sialic acid synthase SpsE